MFNVKDMEKLNIRDNIMENFKRSMAKGLVENNENWFDIKPILSASFNRTLHHINSGAPIMFISACTSKLENETDEQHEIRNKRNTEKLINTVIDLNLSFIKVNGHWVQYDNDSGEYKDFPESTLIVLGYDRFGEVLDFDEFKEIGIDLRDRFHQWAVLIGRNLGGNDLDFKYYNADNSTNEFGTISITNNKDVKTIVDKYNKDVERYIRRHKGSRKPKIRNKIEKLKSKTNGWTEYSKNRNISLSSTVVTKKRPFFGSKEDEWLFME